MTLKNRISQSIAKFIIYRPLGVFTVYFALCILSLTQIIDFPEKKVRLELDPSVNSILPKQDPERDYFEYSKELFDSGEQIILALQAEEIFTTDNLQAIKAISDAVELLPEVKSVSSLSMALNIRSEQGELLIQPFFDFPPTKQADLNDLKQRALNDPIYAGNLVSHDSQVTVILVSLLDIEEKELLARSIDQTVKAIAEEYWPRQQVYMSGGTHVKAEMSRVMLEDLKTVVPLAAVIMALIAGLSFRSIRGMVVPVATVGVSLLLTLGVFQVFFQQLNQVTVVVPSLLIVVGFAYAIHVVSAYYDVLQNKQEALQQSTLSPAHFALRKIAAPVIYTGVTTSAGFFSLMVSPISAIQEFALGAGVGILITTLVSLSLAPAILQTFSIPMSLLQRKQSRGLDSFFELLANIDLNHSKIVLLSGAGIALLSLMALPYIQIGTDMVSSFKDDSTVRRDFNKINESLQGGNTLSIVFSVEDIEGFKQPENLKVIEQFQSWLSRQHYAGGSTSLVDYIKVINQGLNESNEQFAIPDDRYLIEELLFVGGNDELDRYVDFEYQHARVVLRTPAMDSRDVMALVDAIEYYFQERLPAHMQGRITGNSYLLAKTMDDIAVGQALSITTAFIIIYFILVLLFTSFKAGFIALIPNALPVLLYFGVLGWTGISLNVTTGLVACIVLGIAVDDTIHLMAHFNRSAREKADEAQGVIYALKTVGRPVTYTTIALCLGFLCMLSSDMRTQIDFAWLAALTLFFAWIVDMTFTPAVAGRIKIVSLWDVLSLNLGESPHKSIPLFAGLTPTQARIAALMANIVEYPQAQQIFAIGDKGNHMYVVIDGVINVTLKNGDGTIFIDKLERGAIIGEVALYHGERTANVFAASNVRLLEITKQDLEAIQLRHPKIAAQLYANLNEVFAGRMANLTHRIAT